MAESKSSDIVEEDGDLVPQKIDDDFFKAFQVKTKTVIKELREHEQYQLAGKFIQFFSITEILFANLKDEPEQCFKTKKRFFDCRQFVIAKPYFTEVRAT